MDKIRRGKLMRRFIIRLTVAAAMLPVHAWYVMLAVGIAHRDWWPQVPAMGYGDAVLLTVLLGTVFGSLVSQATDKDRS